ncbi:hypothetical protein DSECCO2_375660 [anaerobic digester metagenome]
MASGDKFYLADKETLDRVDEKLGSTKDTGGSSTAGSVFGKINYLVSQVSSYLATIYSWVNTLVGKIGNTNDSEGTATTGSVTGKLNFLVTRMGSVYSWMNSMYSWVSNIYSRMGATTDTGGTTTAGSVMAKENAILTEVNKIGTSSDTGGNETTGSVFAKLNYLVNQVKTYISGIHANSVTAVSKSAESLTVINLVKSYIYNMSPKIDSIYASNGYPGTVYSSNTEIYLTRDDSYTEKCVAKFIVPKSGIYRIDVTCKNSGSRGNHVYMSRYFKGGRGPSLIQKYMDLSIGSSTTGDEGLSSENKAADVKCYLDSIYYTGALGSANSTRSAYAHVDLTEGEPFILMMSSYRYDYTYLTNISIKWISL